MRHLPTLSRRTLALGLITASVVPLMAALHHHAPDHDGVAHHIEAAHGHHAPTVVDSDDRRASTGFDVILGALPAPMAAPELPGVVQGSGTPSGGSVHAARGPPGSHRTRAPPA